MKTTFKIFKTIALFSGLSIATLSAQDAIRHLSPDEASKAAVSKVQPEYPPIGRQLKLEGSVQVEASIDERGAVESVKVVSGNVVLANSAVAAVKRWKFAPMPGKANATLNFTFKL